MEENGLVNASEQGITPEMTQTLVQFCTDENVNADKAYRCLMNIVRYLTERLESNRQDNLQLELDIAKRVSSLLRRYAQKNGMLQVYYFGIYQEKLEQLQGELTELREIMVRQGVVGRKNFAPIMQTLYKNSMMCQSELADLLGIEKGNLSREMDKLAEAGFVEQRRIGKYKQYNLSANGRAYYDQYLKMQSQLDPVVTCDEDKLIHFYYYPNPTFWLEIQLDNTYDFSNQQSLANLLLSNQRLSFSDDYKLEAFGQNYNLRGLKWEDTKNYGRHKKKDHITREKISWLGAKDSSISK